MKTSVGELKYKYNQEKAMVTWTETLPSDGLKYLVGSQF